MIDDIMPSREALVVQEAHDYLEDMSNVIEMELPPREVLWDIVQEARDYLYLYLTEPSSRRYGSAEVIYDSQEWGSIIDDGNQCLVCLAGLWYLRKEGILLEDMLPELPTLPRVADFLDELRYPNPRHLGINLPLEARRELTRDLLGDDEIEWNSGNPEHHLLFLDWLLARRGDSNG